MEKTSKIGTVCGIFFTALYLTSISPGVVHADDIQMQQQVDSSTNPGVNVIEEGINTNPDYNVRRPSDVPPQENLNPGQQMQQQLEKERRQNFKSLKQDEAEYYKNAAPKSSDNPDYFMHGHPLKANPLKSKAVQ